MILVDANLLLYAYDAESPHHDPSRNWLEATLSSGHPVRFALVSLLAFARISSDRRIYTHPLSPSEACSLIEKWLALPNVRILQPGPRAWRHLSRMCEEGQAKGAMVMDAHLAALAMEHGASVATTDRDFMRFPNIRIVNPVEAAP
ncbi:MAG: PIN domain-containing protein [Immundisolibacterales bacterium]|nr:PIN domain-containing protein [Immundisolibacterales bacterium]